MDLKVFGPFMSAGLWEYISIPGADYFGLRWFVNSPILISKQMSYTVHVNVYLYDDQIKCFFFANIKCLKGFMDGVQS